MLGNVEKSVDLISHRTTEETAKRANEKLVSYNFGVLGNHESEIRNRNFTSCISKGTIWIPALNNNAYIT
jgi:hypothetical protein